MDYRGEQNTENYGVMGSSFEEHDAKYRGGKSVDAPEPIFHKS